MKTQTTTFHIKGMTCAACASRIEKVLGKTGGIVAIHVNLAMERGKVIYDPTHIDMERIALRVNQLGFTVLPDMEKRDDPNQEIRLHVLKSLFAALLSFPLIWAMVKHIPFLSGMWVPALFLDPFFQLLVTFPIQFGIGYSFYAGAWNALRHRSANMDVLVALSTSVAFFYSHYLTFRSWPQPAHATPLYYETSALIITFLCIGKLLEAISKNKTLQTIEQLYQLQATHAVLVRDGSTTTVPISEVQRGDLLLVGPGDIIPADGQIVDGSSAIDESAFTGESIPVQKQAGDRVIGATRNVSGTLKVLVTKVGKDTALSKIIEIVEEAQGTKAPIQRIADELTALFVPIIISIAAITFVAWYLVLQPYQAGSAMEKAIAVLIVACPCALGLATPTSILVGSSRAAKDGVLFKQGKDLEQLHQVEVIAFDKTGTLTTGQPEVTDVWIVEGRQTAFWQMLGAVEKTSEHPVAQAMARAAARHTRRFPAVGRVEEVPGMGIRADVEGKEVVAGSVRFLQDTGIRTDTLDERIRSAEEQGKNVVLLAVNGTVVGMVAVMDTLKPGSRKAVSQLKKLGKELIMLTGDNVRAAEAVARQVGIIRVHAEVLPHEKAAIVQTYQHAGRRVAMIGDGINDAPALSVADIGVAVGTGTNVAISTADVVIMRKDLGGLVAAVSLSQATMRNIKQNLFWALAYNCLGIPLTMLGLLAPWVAGAAMALSSISVVWNALRLRNVRV
ncbi:MAG: heavy metal translocating P-type ATPase [Clostridia bacterium]